MEKYNMVDLAKADIRAIAAVGTNGAIGLNGKLPWNKEKGDLPFFQQMTMDGIVVFGAKTVKNLPHLEYLPGRRVRIWHKLHTGENRNPQAFLQAVLEPFKNTSMLPTIWIAGGEQTYHTFAPWTKSLCLTSIDYNGPADCFFPFNAFFNMKSLENNYLLQQNKLLEDLEKGNK